MSEKSENAPVPAMAVTQQGSTFAERKAAREALEADVKQVDAESTENKAVKSAATKSKKS